MTVVKHPLPSQIQQPGPTGAPYIAAPTSVEDFEFILPAGVPIAAAIAQELATRQYAGAYVYFSQAAIAAADYVIPEIAPTAEHVAWYSQLHHTGSGSQFEHAGIICGSGDPYYHCHASVTAANGQPAAVMGHFLLDKSTLSQPVCIKALGFRDAFFKRINDPQTGFKLLCPEIQNRINVQQADAILLRIAPNIEVSQPILELCQKYQWRKASVHGIGSLIGAHFTDGSCLNNFMTEFLITDGKVDLTGDSTTCQLDIVIVSAGGQLMRGTLQPHANPVLITCEFIIRKIN